MKTYCLLCLFVVIGTLPSNVDGLSRSTTPFRGISQLTKVHHNGVPRSWTWAESGARKTSLLGMSASGDEEIEEKLLDNQMIFSLSTMGNEAFDFSSQRLLTAESLQDWESRVDTLAGELNSLTNKPILLAVYASILKKAAIKELDPMQMATFQLFSNAIMDALVKLHNPMEAITSLIDEVTDVHLDFVDKFQPMIDDGGDDG